MRNTGRSLSNAAKVLLLLLMIFPTIMAEAAPPAIYPPAAKNANKGKAAEAFTPASGAADPRVLGCILPLTGRFASYGNRALDAVILAMGLFDQKKKSPLKLVIEDSQSRPESARAAVAKLVRSGVIAVIGPLGSDEAQAAAEETQRLKVPLLALTQKEGITDAGSYVFRNFLTGSQQVKTLVKFAIENLKLGRFAVLYPDDGYTADMVTLL